MEGVRKAASDVQDSSAARRAPVFSSQRYEGRQGSQRIAGTNEGDERIARLLNRSFSRNDRHSSHRSSNASDRGSDSILREMVLAEASFQPSDLLQEGLDEWHDRSRAIELMKKSQSLASLRRRASISSKIPNLQDTQQPVDEKSNEIPVSQQLDFFTETRHRYNYDYADSVFPGDVDGSLDLPPKYSSTLPNVPQNTLIHLVKLYHQALVKNGLNAEADKIADHLDKLQAADMDDLALELSGIDLLLKDGLLKYLMTIQPYIPTIPRQVIKFKDVSYTGVVQIDAGYESIYTKVLDLLKGPLKKSPLQKVTLLTDVTGYMMPGTLTLVMGTMSCGSLVLNTVLAGQGNKKSVRGSVTYNGRSVHDIKSQRYVSLVRPDDAHMPGLTVRETLEFSRECSQYYKTHHYGDNLKNIVGDVLKVGQDPKLETNLSMMGLKRVAEKPVGGPMMPTITEAERHRVSVAEMNAGTYAVYMFDQLNKGVDDSVTFDLVTSIRIFTRVRSITVVATLIRPPQDVYELFDRVILLDRSHIVYQGPTQDAVPYFDSIGYTKPSHLTVPEFLEEVTTTTDGAKYLKQGFPRLSLDGFVGAYKSSETYKDICRIVDNPEVVEELWVQGPQPFGVSFVQSHLNKGQGINEGPSTTLVSSISEKGGSLIDLSMGHTNKVHLGDEVVAVGGSVGSLNYLKNGDSAKEGFQPSDQPQETIRFQLERPLPDEKEYIPQFSRDYVQDPWPEFLLLLDRELKTTWRNKLSLIIRAVQVLVLSFFVGNVFFRVKNEPNQLDMNLLKSVFFVSLLDMTLFNLGQLPALIEERKVYYKQQGAHFFRPSSYLFAKIVGSVPFSLAEATVWTIVVYFFTNLAVSQGGWHFWVFYIIIVLSVLNGAALVRFFSAFAPDMVAANSMIGVVIAIFIVFAGFLLPRFKVPHYWIWAFYLDPLQWGITALMVNEFNSTPFKTLCSQVENLANMPQCRGRGSQTVGHAYLAKGQFYTGEHWIGIAIAVLVGWFILWTVLTYLALAKIRHVPKMIVTRGAQARFILKTVSMKDQDLEQQGPRLSVVATPFILSWHELSYDVNVPGIGRNLTLLNYVSGWAEPGEMVGVLGAVGSGSLQLLNCLAGRGVDLGRIGGQILVNGYPKNQKSFAKVSGYADRLEAYSPYMTIREAIVFSCDLQLQNSIPLDQRRKFVQEIIALVDLESIQDSLVKSLAQSNLTLAEATRLRIGTELARNPSVLFVDAPTKNLDSRSALHMIKTLRAIADTGRIVMCDLSTSRSQRLLTYFSSIQILKRGGETVYWGPVGKDGELIKKYFESIPGTPPCHPNYTVSSYALDVIGDGGQERKSLKDYAFEYRVNELALHNHFQLQQLRRAKGTLGPEIGSISSGASHFTRARYIFMKLQYYYWRNVTYSWGRLFSSIVTSLLLGSIFFNIDDTNTPGMNAKASGIFISTLLYSLTNAQSVIPQVLINQADFARERSNRQFHLSFYVVNWTLLEIQYLSISTLVFAAIFCNMTQLAVSSANRFFLYWFVLFLTALAVTFFGMLLAALSKLPQIAGTVVTLFIGFWVATSGVVVPKKKILHQFIWIYWTNPLQFGITAMTSINFFCDVDKPECQNNGQLLGCATNPALCPQCDCTRLKDANNAFTWSTIKFNRSLHHGIIPYEILALILFAIIFRLGTYLYYTVVIAKQQRG